MHQKKIESAKVLLDFFLQNNQPKLRQLMTENYLYKSESPFGDMLLIAEQGGLTDIRFLPESHDYTQANILHSEPGRHLELTKLALDLLFFQKTQKKVRIPIILKGSNLQNKVWNSLLAIPFGTTTTYKKLAEFHQSSPIAIGQIVAKNPVPIILPCHRVIGSDGDLVGYRGGLARKEYLLALEKEILDIASNVKI